jgi:ATP-dependent Clp protease ATP-binding subunit ClpA
MFERFNDRARRVIVLAQEEARMLNHNYIGTEHILLGLVHEGEGVAAQALESLNVSLDLVRQQVEEIIGEGQAAPTGHIPFSPRAKKVLELSLREALKIGHNYIGTEHILLGLIREGEGIAARVLWSQGLDVETIQDAVFLSLVGVPPEPSAEGGPTPTEDELVKHAADLARVYSLLPLKVEEARRILALDRAMAKPQLALFLRFTKQFGLDPVDLAHVVVNRRGDESIG